MRLGWETRIMVQLHGGLMVYKIAAHLQLVTWAKLDQIISDRVIIWLLFRAICQVSQAFKHTFHWTVEKWSYPV